MKKLQIIVFLTTVVASLLFLGCDDFLEQIFHSEKVVIFYANGGSGPTPPAQTVDPGTVVILPGIGSMAYVGKTFNGWNTQANGSGTSYAEGASYTVTGNVALYAQWGIEGMVWIPAGSFTMGSPLGEMGRESDEIQHQVTLTSGFYMGKYEVTQAQYQLVMGSLPGDLTSNNYGKGDNYPVYYVTWYDALVFCNRLSIAESLTPAYRINGSTDPAAWGTIPTSSNSTWNNVQIVSGSTGYRLPTEAQWEYACRAGTTTAFNWETNTINSTQANYNSNLGRTDVVGSYAPNAWGLYDMHGNVVEWCQEWVGNYSSGAQTDPAGVVSGLNRVVRGGSWIGQGTDLRSGNRGDALPYTKHYRHGFRLVRPDL